MPSIQHMLIITLTLLCLASTTGPTLDKHIIPLYGNATLGYYYANIYVGTPPQQQSVIMDTGSGQLAIPCSKCISCGTGHIHPPFRLSDSSTSSFLSCNSREQVCEANCGHKGGSEPCTFSISYAEGSSLSGIILQDYIQFQKNSVEQGIKSPFGCTTKETNLFYTQAANGIFGLAPKRQIKLLDDLYNKHSKITGEEFLFSICLAKNGGQLVIGRSKPEIHKNKNSVKTPFKPTRNLYSLDNIGDIKLGSHIISAKGQYLGVFGVFLDSGSTFTYLPRNNYRNLEVALQNSCALHPGKCLIGKQRSSCFKITPGSNKTVSETITQIFPPFDIQIAGQTISWSPNRYFLLKNQEKTQICLGIEALDRFILGANWMVDRDIIFNLQQSTVQIFTDSVCTIGSLQVKPNYPQLPIYIQNSINKPLSYSNPVFRMNEDNLISLIFVLLGIVGLILLLLMVLGKMFDKKKVKSQNHDEQKEGIKQGQISDRRLQMEGNNISNIKQNVAIITVQQQKTHPNIQ